MIKGLSSKAKNENIGVSVLVPARDEGGNLPRLLTEICAALDGETFEIIVVDDASIDDTASVVESFRIAHPEIRLIRNRVAAGKSGALWIAAQAAGGELGITIDGDGQNDPRYLRPFIEILRAHTMVGLVAGQRERRGDGSLKRIASKIANSARGWILNDHTRDTACGLKAFRLDAYRSLPYFETMHRFLPALFTADGWEVKHHDVVDRPRKHGTSKYGVIDRLAVGIPDLFGVWWLIRRRRRHVLVESLEVE